MSFALALGVPPLEATTMTEARITPADMTISNSVDVRSWRALSSRLDALSSSNGRNASLTRTVPHANKARHALMRNKAACREILYPVIDNATPPMTITGSGGYPRLLAIIAARIIKIAIVAVYALGAFKSSRVQCGHSILDHHSPLGNDSVVEVKQAIERQSRTVRRTHRFYHFVM